MSASILIVEDDAALRRGLLDNFRAQGYEVRVAVDGRSGLAEAITDPPDLIVLDIMLPYVNGYEVCRQLRERRVTTPILMLTAKGQEHEIVQGLELGADDYVTKPFHVRELLARVKRFIRRQQLPEEPTVFTFGTKTLDTVAQKLSDEQGEVHLTSKEYQVLAYLVSRRNCAVTRHEIMDRVWGRSVLITSRSVDRCITTLRGKLEPNPREPTIIRTLRDVGYRLELPW